MNRNELQSYLEARGEKVVDLGIGYDFEAINEEIANGVYSKYTTIAHGKSGIDADCFYGDSQQEIRFPVIVEGTDEWNKPLTIEIKTKNDLIDLINQWEHPQNSQFKIQKFIL